MYKKISYKEYKFHSYDSIQKILSTLNNRRRLICHKTKTINKNKKRWYITFQNMYIQGVLDLRRVSLPMAPCNVIFGIHLHNQPRVCFTLGSHNEGQKNSPPNRHKLEIANVAHPVWRTADEETTSSSSCCAAGRRIILWKITCNHETPYVWSR